MSVSFTGTWIADLSKSRLLGPAPKSISVKIEHSDSELREEMCVTTATASEQQMVFQCRTDRADEAWLNGTAIRGSARWEGAEFVIETWMQVGAREMHFCDYWSVSPDDQTLRMEHRNDDLDGQLTVLHRAAPRL